MSHLFFALKENITYTIDSLEFSDLAGGNEQAFTKIVHAIYKRLFLFIMSLVKSEVEADDILQEVFCKIWVHRESLATIENPIGWVFRVTANIASNHLRSQIRNELRIRQMNVETISPEDIEERIDAKLMQSIVAEAVAQLPVKRKLVFLLSRRDGLSRKQIAEQLQISENTVRNQLAEATRFIHDYLSKKRDPIIPTLFILQCLVQFFLEKG